MQAWNQPSFKKIVIDYFIRLNTFKILLFNNAEKIYWQLNDFIKTFNTSNMSNFIILDNVERVEVYANLACKYDF